MSGYDTEWDFHKDTARLIAAGATLRDLHVAMMSVREPDLGHPDVSPSRMRDLASTWTQWPTFVVIRLNELYSGLQLEHNDDYVLALVGGLGGRREQEIRLHLLRHDAELRDEIFWRVFEVEGGGEVSLANIDKFSHAELNWHNTVLLLAGEGTLSRTRLLRSCLQALNRDFSAYRAGWFSRVYTDLVPTAAESATDQDLLRLTLTSTVTATVTLGVKQLATVHRAGLLETEAFVDTCAPALSGSKAAAMTVVRMLTALAASGEAEADAVVAALLPALGHPHADVQRAAVKALTGLGRNDLARDHRDLLAPAVVAALLPDVAGPTDIMADVPVTQEIAATPLSPWSDDDAVGRCAALLEDSSDAIEIELALAWLATSPQRSSVLAPLAKRAARIGSDRPTHWLAQLVVVTCDPTVAYLPERWEDTTELPSFLTRLREVAAIVRGQVAPRRLLATPTDSHGWLDTATFRDRWTSHDDALEADLTQALLRLGPDGRDTLMADLGLTLPMVTSSIRIEWRSRGSDTTKANGQPQWVWWDPFVQADPSQEPSVINPGLICTASREGWNWQRGTNDLVTAELALARPDSTLPLTAVAIHVLNSALTEASEHRAPGVLDALARHWGQWSAETVQVVALGMAAQRADIRAQAAELLTAAVPARVEVECAAAGFTACAPAVVLTRWATSFIDAASISPPAVVDLLSALLPQLDHTTRGIGSLVAVLHDESLRLGRAATDQTLRQWLGRFSGGSAAARAARGMLTVTAS